MSQCDQLAALLSDGQWWTTRELLREVPCVVHSRIHELRDRRGLSIEHETTGPGAAGSRYRLTSVAPVIVSDLDLSGASGVGNGPGTGATTLSVEPTVGLLPQAAPTTAGSTLTAHHEVVCPAGAAQQPASALTPAGVLQVPHPAPAGALQLTLDAA